MVPPTEIGVLFAPVGRARVEFVADERVWTARVPMVVDVLNELSGL